MNPIDQHVGKRIRHQRWMKGMSQQDLAARCNVKFQQVQKYETGANRVSASRLWEIAEALKVKVPYFFEGLEIDARAERETDISTDPLFAKEAVDLVRAYYGIPEKSRTQLLSLAKTLAA
ncbi:MULTISPECIES: helix-turn-helix domain-containing protein [unclassified Leisingera]|uniref:helix-turn-helix domain-containing protein n=1 Tax=unclassified Leisingera TaxID=2614906 RepID=UPI0010102BFD|nr:MULTISPECIES: helix-turn-helix transcriptional regulator [unclassified Leisingera]MCF6433436.1 helix-turn-helix domain-containing protein [Leisingera sp. MMG026]QAX32414.1 XRE family transcriptional regulator [Leisingera sp. NJS204]